MLKGIDFQQWELEYEKILEALSDNAGSVGERELAGHILTSCVENISNEDEGLRINARGEISERKTPTVEVIEGASCGDILTALWEDYGLSALESIGISGDEGEQIWEKQNKKPTSGRSSSKRDRSRTSEAPTSSYS